MEGKEESTASGTGSAPESLRTPAQYLQPASDKATSIVMKRHAPGICTLYLGDPSGPREELGQVGAISTSLEDGMLQLTAPETNQMHIGEQIYRCTRSFTQIDDVAAIVFFTKPARRAEHRWLNWNGAERQSCIWNWAETPCTVQKHL